MAVLALQDASAGKSVTPVAAAGGQQIAQGSRAGTWDLGVVLLVRNGSASPVTVTVGSHPAVIVAAGDIGVIPVFGAAFGTVIDITYSATTSVTVAAVRLAGS